MFVCIPDAIPREQRVKHFELANELFQHRATAQEDLADGYAIYFAPDDYDDVTRFVGNERKCSPVIQFEIELSPGGGAIILRMRGPEGARELIKSELPLK